MQEETGGGWPFAKEIFAFSDNPDERTGCCHMRAKSASYHLTLNRGIQHLPYGRMSLDGTGKGSSMNSAAGRIEWRRYHAVVANFGNPFGPRKASTGISLLAKTGR